MPFSYLAEPLSNKQYLQYINMKREGEKVNSLLLEY